MGSDLISRLRQYPDLPRVPIAGQALMNEAAQALNTLRETGRKGDE